MQIIISQECIVMSKKLFYQMNIEELKEYFTLLFDNLERNKTKRRYRIRKRKTARNNYLN